MSYPEIEENPSITVLKYHELMHIFGYLNNADLLRCRLVCPYWHRLIDEEPQLVDRFSFSLTVDSETLITVEELPFSIAQKSCIRCKSLTIQEDFVYPGNDLTIVAANKTRITALSTILAEIGAFETVIVMIVIARDDDTRTNSLLFELIMKMTNLEVLRFTMPAFVHVLRLPNQQQCTSLQHVQIVHENFFQLIIADFVCLFTIFPNVKRIDVEPTEAMFLKKHIFEKFASFFKSVERLDKITLNEVVGIDDMILNHIFYDATSDDLSAVISLQRFLVNQNRIATMSLKFDNVANIKLFFDKEFPQIVELDIFVSFYNRFTDKNAGSMLDNILKYTPNLQRLVVKYDDNLPHYFAHQKVELRQLIHVMMMRFHLECKKCFRTMLKSFVHANSLLLLPSNCAFSLKHLDAIAKKLVKLEALELVYDDDTENENYFERWPAMPNLKQLVVKQVGYVDDACIKNLRKQCPMLKVLKFDSLVGCRIDQLLKSTFNYFPNIEIIEFHCHKNDRHAPIDDLNYIDGKVGWTLKELDISPDIKSNVILKLFKRNDLLETISCKYGSLVVTRRIYFEVEVLQAYDLKSIERPLLHVKRLYSSDGITPDSETSSRCEMSNGSDNN